MKIQIEVSDKFVQATKVAWDEFNKLAEIPHFTNPFKDFESFLKVTVEGLIVEYTEGKSKNDEIGEILKNHGPNFQKIEDTVGEISSLLQNFSDLTK